MVVVVDVVTLCSGRRMWKAQDEGGCAGVGKKLRVCAGEEKSMTRLMVCHLRHPTCRHRWGPHDSHLVHDFFPIDCDVV